MSKCLIVGECGINHNGNLTTAFKLIEDAKQAGCDFVKFQKRTVNLVYTKEELDKPRRSPWGTTNREQKNGLEFNEQDYDDINEYCRVNSIPWFGSPWDVKSVELLALYKQPYIKVASALMTDFEVLKGIKETKIPVIVSTGMTTKIELDNVLSYLDSQVEYILACTSTYPTPPEEINLNFIKTLKDEYPRYKIGFSNHFQGITYVICAAALGAEMIEFHITLDRSMYGSDQASSIEPTGVIKIVKAIRAIETGMGDGKWHVFPGEKPIKKKLRKTKFYGYGCGCNKIDRSKGISGYVPKKEI